MSTTQVLEAVQAPVPTPSSREHVLLATTTNNIPIVGRPTEDLDVADSGGLSERGPSTGAVAAAAAEDETRYPTGIRFWLIVLACAIALVFMAIDTSVVSTAVPSITDEFHTVADVGWYASAFRLCACAFAFFFGKLYTLFPLRAVFLASNAVFVCGSLLSATAPTSRVFVLSRAVCGLGASGALQGCFYMLVHLVPLRRRPVIVGCLSGLEAVANMAGPAVGGLLIGRLSWRWCFWINLPSGALSMLIAAFALRGVGVGVGGGGQQRLPLRRKLAALDLAGNALFVPALTCLFLALTWAGMAYPWDSGIVIGLLATSAALLAAFAWEQRRRGDGATLPPRILGQRSVLAGFIFSAYTNSTMSVFEYYLPTYFQTVRGYGAARSGYLLLPCLLGYTVASVAEGAGISAVGHYVPFMVLASTLMPVCAGLLTTFTTTTSVARMVGTTAAMGFAGGIGFQAPQSAVQTVLAAEDASLGLSVIIFAQQFGPAVAVAAAQTIFLNRLSENLQVLVPGLSPGAVSDMGLSDIKQLVGEADLERALGIFDASLMQTWYLAVGLACATMVGSLGMEWRSVKETKRD